MKRFGCIFQSTLAEQTLCTFQNLTQSSRSFFVRVLKYRLYIAVCKYDTDGGFYLFGCDKDFNTQTDYLYDALDEALKDAERIYEIENIKWIPDLVQR